jgi:RHS repeat-associated protein
VDDVTTRFTWDGFTLLSDHGAAGPREFIFWPDTFEPFAAVNGKVTLFNNDDEGLPRETLDPGDGVLWTGTFDGLGGLAADVNPREASPFRFQGQYFDEEIGLAYNYMRYYDPLRGGFISQDPLGLGAGDDLYAYAPNVWRWLDPFGLTCKVRKRSVKSVAQLRRNFEKSGGARSRFLKKLAKDPNAVKKYGKAGVEKMKKGKCPPGMVVHHKKPLFRGGNNSFSNLDLMSKKQHAKNNKALHWYPEGQNPYGLN